MERLKKIMKTSVRIASVTAEIRFEHLPNKSLELYASPVTRFLYMVFGDFGKI
jgi:hypothetical protein